MKKSYYFLLIFTMSLLFSSCTKVYKFDYDKLFLVNLSDVLNTPQYLTKCKVEIKTSDDININEYVAQSQLLDKWIEIYQYEFMEDCGLSSGLLEIPWQGKGKIKVFSSEKITIELTYKDGIITSSKVLNSGNIKCKSDGIIEGSMWAEGGVTYDYFAGDLIHYNYDYETKKNYKTKEIISKGYKQNCKEFFVTTNLYYPLSNTISQKTLERVFQSEDYAEGNGYGYEIIENIYYENNENIKTDSHDEQSKQFSNNIEENKEKNSNDEKSSSNQKNKIPKWLYAQYRVEISDTECLILFLETNNSAHIQLMQGFSISKIKYDYWKIIPNDYVDYVFLGNEGDRLADCPSFIIDYNRKTLILDGKYMQRQGFFVETPYDNY